MPSILGKIGSAASKLGHKLRPRLRHGPGHWSRKHGGNLALIAGGVGLGAASDVIVNQISPADPDPALYSEGEISPIHSTRDQSFNLIRVETESESFLDEAVKEAHLQGNSSLAGELSMIHMIAGSHRGATPMQRVKGVALLLVILFIAYLIIKLILKVRRCCRSPEAEFDFSPPPANVRCWKRIRLFPSGTFPPSPSTEPSPGSTECAEPPPALLPPGWTKAPVLPAMSRLRGLQGFHRITGSYYQAWQITLRPI